MSQYGWNAAQQQQQPAPPAPYGQVYQAQSAAAVNQQQSAYAPQTYGTQQPTAAWGQSSAPAAAWNQEQQQQQPQQQAAAPSEQYPWQQQQHDEYGGGQGGHAAAAWHQTYQANPTPTAYPSHQPSSAYAAASAPSAQYHQEQQQYGASSGQAWGSSQPAAAPAQAPYATQAFQAFTQPQPHSQSAQRATATASQSQYAPYGDQGHAAQPSASYDTYSHPAAEHAKPAQSNFKQSGYGQDSYQEQQYHSHSQHQYSAPEHAAADAEASWATGSAAADPYTSSGHGQGQGQEDRQPSVASDRRPYGKSRWEPVNESLQSNSYPPVEGRGSEPQAASPHSFGQSSADHRQADHLGSVRPVADRRSPLLSRDSDYYQENEPSERQDARYAPPPEYKSDAARLERAPHYPPPCQHDSREDEWREQREQRDARFAPPYAADNERRTRDTHRPAPYHSDSSGRDRDARYAPSYDADSERSSSGGARTSAPPMRSLMSNAETRSRDDDYAAGQRSRDGADYDYDYRQRERRSPSPNRQSAESNWRPVGGGDRHDWSRTDPYRSEPGPRSSRHADNDRYADGARWSNERRGADSGYASKQPPPPAPLPVPVPVETVRIETLLDQPGRASRPSHLVIILRGLPGSGKTHAAKKIREREMANGGEAPRSLCLDDYFITENEVVEKDPHTGRRVKVKKQEYEYDACAEPSCRAAMLKAFSRTLDDRLFKMVLLDCVNEKVAHFEQFWLTAKLKGFDVYVAEVDERVEVCADRNIHSRTLDEIRALHAAWEATPNNFKRLDLAPLYQEAIEEVDMETTADGAGTPDSVPTSSGDGTAADTEQQDGESSGTADATEINASKNNDGSGSDEDDDDADGDVDTGRFQPVRSRWESSGGGGDKLDRLDGLRSSGEAADPSGHRSISDWAGLSAAKDTQVVTRKKNSRGYYVRWVDLEEEKERARKRDIGFHLGANWKDLLPSSNVEKYLAGDS